MPDSPAHRMLSRAQRQSDPLAEYRAVVQGEDKGTGQVAVDPSLGASDRYDPNATPVDAFERYLRQEVEPTLPDRYRNPGRPLHPYRNGPALGIAIVVVGAIVAVVLRGMAG